MTEEKIKMFTNRLSKVFRHIGRQAKRQGITCYRVYDHDLPEFPFCIEFYEEHLYVAEYRRRHGMTEEEHDEWMQECLAMISSILKVDQENIFLKLRQRKAGRLGQYQKTGDQVREFKVSENGLHFLVNLSDYLDTGLFLDHRLTRQMVREESKGKKVLNIFAYTGSFSVYAAAGGAGEIVTVDLSRTYLDWAVRNMEINQFNPAPATVFQQADVISWLGTIDSNSFDLIVMDPPTFSNSKRMDGFLDIQRDHPSLINDSLRILKPGGRLYFSTNFRKFKLATDQISPSFIKDITRSTTPFDFEGKLFRSCFLIEKLLATESASD